MIESNVVSVMHSSVCLKDFMVNLHCIYILVWLVRTWGFRAWLILSITFETELDSSELPDPND